LFIPDPDPDFLPIPDPGVKKVLDLQHNVLNILKGIRSESKNKYKKYLPTNLSSATVSAHGLADKRAGRPIPENI
jgi:hypothetical protein